MLQYLSLCLVAFAVTFFLIPAIKPIACFVGLVDKPGGRKRHDGMVPLTGGISIFAGMLASILSSVEQTEFIRVLVIGGAMMVAVGAFDDRYDISARFRLVAQLLIAILFTYGLGVKVVNVGNLFGFGVIELGFFANFFTVICIIALINALNMLDGIDGLVGTLSGISLLGLAMLLHRVGDYELAAVCLCLCFGIFAFLIFNLFGSPNRRALSKAFMGDAGSMFLGLMLAVLLVRSSQQNHGVEIAINPVGVFWFVLLPITDMATTIGRRLRRGRSPLAPDRTHIHHIILRAGFTKYQALTILGALQLILVSIGMMVSFSEGLTCIGFVLALIMVAFYQLMINRSWRIVRWSRRRFGLS
ncbi:MAG TPA: undecaprenyl/decaprenyl-phosphate alpha-N-acetylglucosaminyl 1-phosphate transferase [Cellvibrionaceae bacterium]